MQSFIPLQIQEQQYIVKKKNKYGKLLQLVSFLFLIVMFFFSTIVFASLYTHNSLIVRHLKTFVGTLSIANKDMSSIKHYYNHQHEADYVFALLLFIFVCVTLGLWAIIFLFREQSNLFNSRMSHGLLHFFNFIICITCIVCFIYYMSVGEDDIDNIQTIQNHMEAWKKQIVEGEIATTISFEYISGYVYSILDIIRPFVITDFILSIIYMIVSFALLGLQASKEKIFRAI